ncbi:MAG: hypothetical protein ABI623_09220, partial [bacterium]
AISLPWILLSTRTGNILPALNGMNELSGHQGFLGLYILAGIAVVGFGYVLTRDREEMRIHVAGLVWIVSALAMQVWLLATPLIVVYGFFGLQKISSSIADGHRTYILALTLATALLLYQQMIALPAMRQAFNKAADETEELKSIAVWLRTHVKSNEQIEMPSGHEGLLRYYSERLSGEGSYIVAADANLANVQLAFDPRQNEIVLDGAQKHYSVWRKK